MSLCGDMTYYKNEKANHTPLDADGCLLPRSIIDRNKCPRKDWANLQRYAQQNAELPKPDKNEKRVVFMGNSITEGWVNTHPDFFKSNGYIGRGIGGQTSYQFLVRFRKMSSTYLLHW